MGLLFWTHGFNRPHVVQTVGKFDQDNAQIARHRHEQLAEVLSLFCLGRSQLNIGQLCNAIDEFGDFTGKEAFYLRKAGFGVFDRIVQKCRHDRRVVHLLMSENACDGHWVGEIWFPRMTKLPLVHFGAKGKCITEQLFISSRVVSADQRDQFLDCRNLVLPHS